VLIERVDLRRDTIRVSLRLPLARCETDGITTPDHVGLVRTVTMRMKRRGVEKRVVLGGEARPSRIDLALLKAVARGRRWSSDLLSGRASSVRDIARRAGVAGRYVREILPLGFLSPRIVKAIVEGRQPPELTVIDLTRRLELPLLWSAQERALRLD
jgi:site-specific DNA recombinase